MLVDQSARLWAMKLDMMAALEAFEQRKALSSDVRAQSLSRGERLEGSDFARVVRGVAVVPVRGPLLRSMNWAFWSYEEIQRDIELALASDEVEAIVLDIDSPGGLAAGCADLCSWLRAQDAKPITAFVGTMGASAAYMIASAADEIILGSGAIVGSIGTVIEYVDFEPLFEKLGAKVVRVVAEQSPNKRLDPHSEEGKAEMQDICNEGCAEFIAAVSGGRGISENEVSEKFGQGLVFAPSEALSRGMADRKGTLDVLIAELAGRDISQSAAPAAVKQENPKMDWENLSLAALQEHRPDLVSQAQAAARAEAENATASAVQAAAEAERNRINSLDELAAPGHEELIAAAKADGTTTAEELALKMVKADRAAGNSELDRRKADEAQTAVPATPVSGSTVTPVADDAPIEERAKATWDSDAGLRSEFVEFDTYLAFAKAEEAGSVRVKRSA